MKPIIDCPYCDGKAHLTKQNKDLIYRKESFKVVEHFYKCDKCIEEFTTNEVDTITILQAHNQYRERYSIPFPDEIFATREKYGLSAAKMSEVLGLGINGYSLYEKGEMPTPAIGNLINMVANPDAFINLLLKAKDHFQDNLFENSRERVQCLIQKERDANPFYWTINKYYDPNNFTGYKKPNTEKLANVLIAFITNCNKEFNDRLKLNKLLFYLDFSHYKCHGSSVTGISYRAIKFGPVPTNYDNIYTLFENEEIIASDWIVDTNRAGKEVFETSNSFDNSKFEQNELETLDIIIDKFKDFASWDLVDLSHNEKGWLDLNSQKGVISYQEYAFDLKGV
jgi:uncharacterized phage-associated protein